MNGRSLDDLVGRVAAGLGARVARQRAAEERLATFVFADASPAARQPEPPLEGPAPATDWGYYVARAFRAMGDASTMAALMSLRSGARPLRELATLAPCATGDRLAAADWFGGLAAEGLVARELEHDQVALAPLGEALLALAVAIEQRAREGS